MLARSGVQGETSDDIHSPQNEVKPDPGGRLPWASFAAACLDAPIAKCRRALVAPPASRWTLPDLPAAALPPFLLFCAHAGWGGKGKGRPLGAAPGVGKAGFGQKPMISDVPTKVVSLLSASGWSMPMALFTETPAPRS